MFCEQIRPTRFPKRFDTNRIRFVRERKGRIFKLVESFNVVQRPGFNIYSQPGT